MKIFPQNLHVFKMKSIFVRILMFFIAIIFTSIIMLGFVSYSYSSNLLIKEVMDSNLMLIQKAKSDIDKEIVNLDRLTFQLSLQPKIKVALYSTGNDSGYDQIAFSDAIRTLSTVKISNYKISDIWIYLRNSNAILNNNAKFSRELFFQNVYVYKDDVDWDIVKDNHPNFISMGRHQIVADSKEENVISFARGISVDDTESQGTVCINVNEEVFRDTLNNIDKKVPSFTYVVDFNGKPVLNSISKENKEKGEELFKSFIEERDIFASEEGYLRKKISGKEYLAAFTTSQISKWRYITIIPTEVVTEKANKIKQITIATALLCLVLGLVFSYLLTSRIYYPVNELVNYINAFKIKRKLSKGKVKEDELTFINRIVDYVYSENESLKDLFQQNVPILKEKLLYDLTEGKLSEDEFYESSRKLNMEFPFDNYEVIVFDVEDSICSKKNKDSPTMDKRIDEIAAEKYRDKMRVYSLKRGNDKIITIVNIQSDSLAADVIYDFIEEVKDYFAVQFQLLFTVGIGSVYTTPKNISRSLIDAMSALKYKVIKGEGSITHIDEISNIPDHIFDYSFDTEKMIINFVKAGDIEKLQELIDEIIDQNMLHQKTSPEIIENLFNALAGTAVRTIYDIRASVEDIVGTPCNIYKQVLEKSKVESKRGYILNIFEKISDYISSRKQNQNAKIMDRISMFIDKNYNTDISLAQVSEVVGLSSTYLSSIFKEISGGSFVDYVNGVRIEKSKQLLSDPQLTIMQVAEKVGFCSSNTYIKAFKKQEGITPGQFRELKA
jgi:two-component system response regulator YesN